MTPSPPTPTDPLNCVLNGRPAPFAPVAPVYEGLGPLQSRRMELRWRKWRQRLDQAGADLLPVEYQAYFDLELAIHTDIIEAYYPPPAWLALPTISVPDEVAGCAVARHGEDLFWLSANGQESWLPPNLQAHHEALAAQQAPVYSTLWQRHEDPADALRRAAARQAHELRSLPEPAPGQAEALLQSHRYDLARALMRRYPQLPLYAVTGSPWDRVVFTSGFRDTMCLLVDEPAIIHRLLESNLPRPCAQYEAARRLGVGILFMEECLASADLISPRMYLEFVFPYARQALQFFEDMGFRTVLYFSGNLMPLLQHLKELPFTALSFEEDRKNYGIDLAEVRRVLGPERVLFGNIDAPFVETCADDELLAEVRRQIDVAGRDGNFVVSVGSPFTPRTSLERVRLFCESTRMIARSGDEPQ